MFLSSVPIETSWHSLGFHWHDRLAQCRGRSWTDLFEARGLCQKMQQAILLLTLGIQSRQILRARRLDRIFAGKDITRATPGCRARFIFAMCRIDWHGRTIAPV